MQDFLNSLMGGDSSQGCSGPEIRSDTMPLTANLAYARMRFNLALKELEALYDTEEIKIGSEMAQTGQVRAAGAIAELRDRMLALTEKPGEMIQSRVRHTVAHATDKLGLGRMTTLIQRYQLNRGLLIDLHEANSGLLRKALEYTPLEEEDDDESE